MHCAEACACGADQWAGFWLDVTFKAIGMTLAFRKLALFSVIAASSTMQGAHVSDHRLINKALDVSPAMAAVVPVPNSVASSLPGASILSCGIGIGLGSTIREKGVTGDNVSSILSLSIDAAVD